MTWILLFLTMFLPDHTESPTRGQTVNAVIGDASYFVTYGALPNAETDETLRLQTHLYFVHAYLSQVNTDHLTAAQKENRQEVLDILQVYAKNGVFPVNAAYPDQRRPCFIDAEERYCAVGHLMKETVGEELPKAVNDLYQYAYVEDMTEMPEILAWAKEHGLTVTECAMIQPSYNWPNPTPVPPPPPPTTDPGVAITTGVLSGLNTGLTVGNAIQMGSGNGGKLLPLAGLSLGAGQFMLGLYRTAENDGAQTVDVINMSVGMASASMALIQLLRPQMTKQYGSLYLQPQSNRFGQTNGVGVGWVKNF